VILYNHAAHAQASLSLVCNYLYLLSVRSIKTRNVVVSSLKTGLNDFSFLHNYIQFSTVIHQNVLKKYLVAFS